MISQHACQQLKVMCLLSTASQMLSHGIMSALRSLLPHAVHAQSCCTCTCTHTHTSRSDHPLSSHMHAHASAGGPLQHFQLAALGCALPHLFGLGQAHGACAGRDRGLHNLAMLRPPLACACRGTPRAPGSCLRSRAAAAREARPAGGRRVRAS